MNSRPVLAHQCHACNRYWALRVVDHPSGKVVLCRYCSTVRAVSPVGHAVAAVIR